jgi:hypothetical protein
MRKIIFVNTHGYGDVLHSRQGVRWVINNLGQQFEYYYVSTLGVKPCHIHNDVKYINLPRDLFSTSLSQIKMGLGDYFDENDLWIDVWAASYEKMKPLMGYGFKLPDENGNYHPGCKEIQDTTKWQTKLYKEKVQQINDFLLLNFTNKKLEVPDHKQFVCQWNDNPQYKFVADKLVRENKNFDLRVMICNGHTSSAQRENFIYEDILKVYITDHPNICFYLTAKINELKLPNVFYIDDNFPSPNLDEIEYLMKFCDVIVTSQSGPGCLCFTDAVVYDKNKTLVLFCNDIIEWYFDEGDCKYVRTPNFEESNVLNTIASCISEYINKK